MSDEYIISGGLGGKSWATYRRKPNGSLHRVVSMHLPVRATQAEAQRDFEHWVSLKANLGSSRERQEFEPIYREILGREVTA